MSHNGDPSNTKAWKNYVEPPDIPDLYPNQPELDPLKIGFNRLSEAIRTAGTTAVEDYRLMGR